MISSPIDEIKNRLDIVEVIGSYIKLQKAGINYRAICPFHPEKRPSFFVSPSRQIWHCFGGCGIGGDIFKFVMQIEGVEFGDALRILARRAGIELKRQTPEMKSERKRLYEICELAAKFFEKQFEESKAGKEAKKYLLARGINQESLKKWRVGYAPDVWQGLSDFLSSRGYQEKEIEKSGLALSSTKGSFYDRFRGRIIFPVFDLNSQVIGFGGRVFKEKDKAEIAKYVNSPQTLLYDKSRILYGLDKAKVAIRRKDFCILVEGYVDLMMVSQAGFENIVATSGTALTLSQLQILKRYTENILIAFDMDLAGNTATKRGIDLAQSQGFNVKVVVLPEGMDPADLVLKDVKEWEKSVKEAESIMDFYFNNTFSSFDKDTAEGKKKIAKVLMPVIKRIPNKIEQSYWVGELAKKLGVKEESIEEEMKKVKNEEYSTGGEKGETENKEVLQKPRRQLIEERIITLVLKSPKATEILEERISCFSPQTQDVFKKIKENPETSFEDLDEEFKNILNCLALKAEIEEMEEKDIFDEVKYCLKEIQSFEIKNQLDIISKELKKAEEEKNEEKIEELMKKFKEVANQLASLS